MSTNSILTWLVPVLSRISYRPVFAMAALLVPVAIGSLFLIGGEISQIDTPPPGGIALKPGGGARGVR